MKLRHNSNKGREKGGMHDSLVSYFFTARLGKKRREKGTNEKSGRGFKVKDYRHHVTRGSRKKNRAKHESARLLGKLH